MARGRREMEGDVAAFVVWKLALVALMPGEVARMKVQDLNPFREREPESEMLQEHKRKLAAMQIAAVAEANQALAR